MGLITFPAALKGKLKQIQANIHCNMLFFQMNICDGSVQSYGRVPSALRLGVTANIYVTMCLTAGRESSV